MAGENGQSTDPVDGGLLEKLRAKPYAFDFFQALRRLENHFRDRPKTGTTLSPREDPVRFGQPASMAFPTSTLESLEEDGEHPPRLNVNFFGMLGPNGPLPSNLTEYTRDRARNARDTTLGAFLDVFHHRMIALFYRAWAVNQKAVDYDRPEDSRFFTHLGSFLGLGDPSLHGRDSVPDNAKIYYFGRLAVQSRNAAGLAAILSDYFQIPAAIETFFGHWLPIPAASHCRLGWRAESATLGISSILGERIRDVQTRFRVRLGPLDFTQFRNFLPTERSFRRLSDWIAFYTAGQFYWDAQIVLKAAEVPATQLGGDARLGWTTWLRTAPFDGDSGDLIIEGPELPNH